MKMCSDFVFPVSQFLNNMYMCTIKLELLNNDSVGITLIVNFHIFDGVIAF